MVVTTLVLTGCASHEQASIQAPLIPMASGPQDPPDELARAAVQDFLTQTGGPASSIYDLRRIDLNNDGRREALVLFKNPYGFWCDMHGCTMLVLQAHDDKFALVNAVQPVREPLYIADTETNGWKNLGLRISGRWSETKDVTLQFDGTQYPMNPTTLPPFEIASNENRRLFHDY